MFEVFCPLCKCDNLKFLSRFCERDYYRCEECVLAFVPSYDHLSSSAEVLRYDKHNNGVDNPGYVKYLEEVADYVARIPVKDPQILDFGCYRNKVLVSILKKMGYDCEGYDPCYHIGLAALLKKYDLVVLCEVIEHLCDPDKEIDLIKTLLKDKTGHILIRTELYSVDRDIEKWWYTNDETHIFMPSEHTISLIGLRLKRQISYSDGKRYVILGPN
jgi:hypothetical protein